MEKQKYRIRNWKQYNKSLVNRGSITFWFSEDSVSNWNASQANSKRGRPFSYSDTAILCALTLRAVYNLPLRAIQGFLLSIISILNLKLDCPDYSTLSRRSQKLELSLPRKLTGKKIDVVIDSTGLKIYGEGEWKVRKYGPGKRRTWRKLHLAIDPESHEIVAEVLTTNAVTDGSAAVSLMNQIQDPIDKAYGDRAYDKRAPYAAILRKGGVPIIPPQINGRRQNKKNFTEEWEIRDKYIKRIEELGDDEEARKMWKKENNYHRRSLGETAMFRFKTIFGDKLRSKSEINQVKEAAIKCAALNKMTQLGMPESKVLKI
jgi:IS5 family transposase